MIQPDYLRRVMTYDPATGEMRWREKVSVKTVVGRVAGTINLSGYRVIGLGGRTYYAHRLAWFHMKGEWPAQVDHIDGDRANNAWANLRLATHQQNILNAKRAANNTSGFKGVSWHKGAGRWSAYIILDGRKQHLGLFDCPQAAHSAYLSAAAARHPNFVRAL